MIRHLTTLVLSGVLGSMVLVGNAEACHKKKCGCAAPVACVAPARTLRAAVSVQPAPCVKPVARLVRPRSSCCNFKLPTFCHKKPCTGSRHWPAPRPVYYAVRHPGQLSHRLAPGLGSALSPRSI